jgi:NitT/TauT family transport system permease protein
VTGEAIPRTAVRVLRHPVALAAAGTAGVAALVLLVWWTGSTLHWWRAVVMPAPWTVGDALLAIGDDPQFWPNLRATIAAICASFTIGSVLGIAAAALLWRLPTLGRVIEPYVVSFYAVPIVVFYPVMLVLVGINIWSLVVLGSAVVMIPVLLNTWVGFQMLRPVYLRLAQVLRCGPWQMFVRIMLPGALPQIAAGLRLGASMAVVGVVSMEFLQAPGGLGFRVRYLYESFEQGAMWAHVIVVFALAVLLMGLASWFEDAVERRRR